MVIKPIVELISKSVLKLLLVLALFVQVIPLAMVIAIQVYLLKLA